MIEINLLPKELKKKESVFKKIDLSALKLKDIPLSKVLSGFAAALIAFHILLFAIGIYAKFTVNSLSKTYKELKPRKEEADLLKRQALDINKKVNAIDELMVKRFSWAKKLNDLSDSMTPGIWLTELFYDEKLGERSVQTGAARAPNNRKNTARPATEKVISKYLILSGHASSMGEQGTALIGKFIKSLKDNQSFYSDFADIALGSIKSDKVENQEVMSFKIICRFK